MGYKELLLAVGAIMLFGMTILNANRQVREQNKDTLRREFQYYAISLASSFIEDAKTRAYDENIISSTPPNLPAGFTSPSYLTEESETYPNFDDIDDFNGFTTVDTSGRDDFTVGIGVCYVDLATPDSCVTYETFYKRYSVTVDNNHLPNPVQMSYVFGYLEN